MTNKIRLILTVIIVSLLHISNAPAQEGYPLDGTWRGEWEPADGEQNQVVIIMNWDGEGINGLMNPGRNSFTFQSASLDPETWTVHIEAVDNKGVPISIDGKLENIGSYRRTITGAWIQDGVEYPFKMNRE